MTRLLLSSVMLPLAASAVDLSRLADVSFAERYAFSTNRQEVLSMLRPESDAWYAYAVLTAQNEGRLADAKALLKRWEKSPSDSTDRYGLRLRQALLAFDEAKPNPLELSRELRSAAGIAFSFPDRETPLAPNTYPSVLDQKDISFDAFGQHSGWLGAFDPAFAFLSCLDEPSLADKGRRFNPDDDRLLPDTPGLVEAALAWLKDEKKPGNVFRRNKVFVSMTLAQLERLAEALKGTPKDLYGNGDFAQLVLEKLAPGADDDFAADPAAEERLLRQRIAFADRLLPALRHLRLDAYRKLLEFARDRGRETEFKSELLTYLAIRLDGYPVATRGQNLFRCLPRWLRVTDEDRLVFDFLCAFRRAGSDLGEFADTVALETRERVIATADLLAGRPAETTPVSALGTDGFAELRDRVELNWSRANPTLFAADDDVKLTINVKNVRRMRLSVYELDAFAACCALKGEAKSDIDLDGAVPTVSRAVDFSRFPSLVRHAETLILPELKESGVYVVECSGAGVCSRAVVRKGRLRATVRRDGAGHVFTALDEKGHVVKDAKLRLGETVFAADANGEIAVPFAADAKSAGRKVAVVGAGRLATTVAFDHVTERLSLGLAAVLPSEALVAGRRATALLRPSLAVSGKPATLELLKDARLTLTFTDLDGHETVVPYPDLALADAAESVVTFTVPERLVGVRFALTGTVRRAVTGTDETLEATAEHWANEVCRGTQVEQAFLRRTAKGYRIELRGRNGEPLADRAVGLEFSHRAFRRTVRKTLQTNADGILELGPLTDIRRIAGSDHADFVWDIGEESPSWPAALTAAEGESLELPVRDLLAGDWPGAARLAVRVSLLGVNAAGAVTKDWISACSYRDGVLKLSGLPAGDYTLTLRDRGVSCKVLVTKTVGVEVVGEGGVLAGSVRSLTDVGDPSLLRIASATCATNGVLSVRLANATPASRVHVFAARYRPDVGEGPSPAQALAAALTRPAVSVGTWGGRGTDYVSGRRLGEKLQYVLERREQPHRVGNMLDRPSLLLNPWSVSETVTTDVKLSDGNGWDAVDDIAAASAEALDRLSTGSFGCAPRASGYFCRDFLPEAETVVANARPDVNGCVTIDLAAAAEVGLAAQDVTIVVTDGETVDSVSLVGPAVPFAPRDRRHRPVADAARAAAATRTCASDAELFPILQARGLPRAKGDFSFLARWKEKTDAEKRALYDTYASHELDFFLYERDRAFFDAVVRPHLANKRDRRFVDRWLLGEDLSAYAVPGARENLNAFELCLLARRLPALAPQVARRLADWCEAHPLSVFEIDAAYDTVLGAATEAPDAAGGPVMKRNAFRRAFQPYRAVGSVCDECEVQEICAEAEPALPASAANWSSQAAVLQAPASEAPRPAVKVAEMRSSRAAMAPARKSRAEVARRANRQLYRPPERTREWVETHYYRCRPGEMTRDRVVPSIFWRDYAAAIAAGTTDAFASENILFAVRNETEGVMALAVTKAPVVFTRPSAPVSGDLTVTRRFHDPSAARADGSTGAEVRDEFVAGRPYTMVTVVTNPTDERRRESLTVEIPAGAIALGQDRAVAERTFDCASYSAAVQSCSFYFPEVTDAVPVDGKGGRVLPVVAKPTKTDTESWNYVSQNATKGEVLQYLRTKNLDHPSVDLSKIVWRMKDGAYARQVLDVLTSRGVYCQNLWCAGFAWRDAFDADRIRQVLARRENYEKVARAVGTALVSPLVTVEPERANVFEHKEYWPLINARAHAVGGAARLANRELSAEYRAFLDTLAGRRALTPEDRLLACVYLVAQDRLEEAKEQLALAGDVAEQKMQVAYLKAYLAFCDGDVAKGRALAAPYADHPVAHWAKRFREVLAQADEIEGKTPAAVDAEAAKAPTLALASLGRKVVISSRNLGSCTLKAYPTDLEITFSKDPFGVAAKKDDTVRCLKPAWSAEVKLASDETSVELPASVAVRNLVLVATGAEGRAEAQLEVTPHPLDVQVTREYRQLRVRSAEGKTLPGAYVKVYAKSADGRAMKFHKDGYTDLRGAFDYASVSTDTDFKPSEYAILVIDDKAGTRTLRVAE